MHSATLPAAALEFSNYKTLLIQIIRMGSQRMLPELTMENNKETWNGETRTKKEEVAANEKNEGKKEEKEVPLMALNHVSRLCRNVKDSLDFYTKVLGFVPIDRPPAFDFDGAWLFNYGVGIHLVQSNDEDKLPDTGDLDPMDNHISFQCENMGTIEKRLMGMDVKYMKRMVEDKESGKAIAQMFFKDPDGFMIEICNCENLKLVPAGSLGKIKLPFDSHNPPVDLGNDNDDDDGDNVVEAKPEETRRMNLQ